MNFLECLGYPHYYVPHVVMATALAGLGALGWWATAGMALPHPTHAFLTSHALVHGGHTARGGIHFKSRVSVLSV